MAGEINNIAWRKSSRCASNACLETAPEDEHTLVRDSKHVGGIILSYSNPEWSQITNAAAEAGKRVAEAKAEEVTPELREFGVPLGDRTVVVHHLGEFAYQLATADGPVTIEYALVDSKGPDAVQEYSAAEIDAWLGDAHDDKFAWSPTPA